MFYDADKDLFEVMSADGHRADIHLTVSAIGAIRKYQASRRHKLRLMYLISNSNSALPTVYEPYEAWTDPRYHTISPLKQGPSTAGDTGCDER